MDNSIPQPNRIAAALPPLVLTQEESTIISLLRSNAYQEISVQVQDGAITSVDQTIKFRRKKGGGLIFGAKKITRENPSPVELEVIKLLRDNAYQQVTIMVMDSEIKGFNQTVKFKKKD